MFFNQINRNPVLFQFLIQSTPRFRRESEAFRVGIMPGTLWCGDGSLAEELSSLGAHVGADRCCRQHGRNLGPNFA